MMVFWSADPETTSGVYGALRGHASAATGSRSSASRWSTSTRTTTTPPSSSAASGSRRARAPTRALGAGHRPRLDRPRASTTRSTSPTRTTGFDEWKRLRPRRRATACPRRRSGRRPRPASRRATSARSRASGAARRPILAAGGLGRLRRRLPHRHRQRVGARHGLPRWPCRAGQAGHQHRPPAAGRAARLRLLLPRLRRGRHLGRPDAAPPAAAVNACTTRMPQLADASTPSRRRSRACSIPEAIIDGHCEWLPARTSRTSHRGQFQRVPVPGAGLLAGADVLHATAAPLRHHDRHQPLRAHVPRDKTSSSWSTSPSGWRARRKFADVILPACTNFERWDIGECGQLRRLHPCTTSAQLNHRVIVMQHKCIEPLGESQVGLRDLPGARRRGWASAPCTPRAVDRARLVQAHVRRDATCRSASPGSEFVKKGYYVVPPSPRTACATPALRWFAEGRAQGHARAGARCRRVHRRVRQGPADAVGQDRVRSRRASSGSTAGRPGARPPMHATCRPGRVSARRSSTSKYPLQLISPHPRFSFHTRATARTRG